MDDIRNIMNMIESITSETGGLESPASFVLVDFVNDIGNIIKSLNSLTTLVSDDNLDSEDRERIIAAINNAKNILSDVDQDFSTVSEDVKPPTLKPNGERSFADPNGSSYAARQGFTG